MKYQVEPSLAFHHRQKRGQVLAPAPSRCLFDKHPGRKCRVDFYILEFLFVSFQWVTCTNSCTVMAVYTQNNTEHNIQSNHLTNFVYTRCIYWYEKVMLANFIIITRQVPYIPSQDLAQEC
jgi:hypothetical protein